MDNPDAQIPLNPVSYTITADNPLCASIKNSNYYDYIIYFKSVVFFVNYAQDL